MYPNKIYIEEAFDIEATAGSFKSESLTTNDDGTTVVGVVVYHEGTDAANNGIISLGFKQDGQETSPNAHVDHYRSREASYEEGYKPIQAFTSGKKLQYSLSANKGFNTPFNAQIILIKEKQVNY